MRGWRPLHAGRVILWRLRVCTSCQATLAEIKQAYWEGWLRCQYNGDKMFVQNGRIVHISDVKETETDGNCDVP